MSHGSVFSAMASLMQRAPKNSERVFRVAQHQTRLAIGKFEEFFEISQRHKDCGLGVELRNEFLRLTGINKEEQCAEKKNCINGSSQPWPALP